MYISSMQIIVLNIWINKEFNGMADIFLENVKNDVIYYDYVYFILLLENRF